MPIVGLIFKNVAMVVEGGDGMERRKILAAPCILMMAVCVLWMDALAGQVTIKGTVNEEAQIVADDGEIYEVADTELGSEVATLVGAKVLVMGTIEETEGKKVFTVTAYQVLDEHSEGSIT
jgi:hypothetical protein